MFRIRRIFDDSLPVNQRAIASVQAILKSQFPGLGQSKADKIPDMLLNPFKYNLRFILYIAEDPVSGIIKGFALLSHEPKLQFCYLDYLATDKKNIGKGMGGILYERVREEAAFLKVKGLFYECLPDDPALCRDPEILKQNKSRLRFYEAFGARPFVNTAYETPVTPDADNAPYLVYDELGQGIQLSRSYVREVVRTILKTKYKGICSNEYIEKVVKSFNDDPARLREPRYNKRAEKIAANAPDNLKRIVLVVTDRHAIHHVRDRGYVEAPVRIKTILNSLNQTNLFLRVEPMEFAEKYLYSVHAPGYIHYFKRVCDKLSNESAVYPYVFPIRNQAHPPFDLAVRAGYYCIDTFTPLNRNAFVAAKRAVDCALTAAMKILEGFHIAYALVRPPGHHAEPTVFGGFCYFNNSAIAAEYLSHYGRVAMLDIDYHHGNGQQMAFYRRKDVLTISIHGHPSIAYPYFSGFAHERGENDGVGFNINYPLPEEVNGKEYIAVLRKALSHIRRFRPGYLVVCLGLDTAKRDPTGTWSLQRGDFSEIGKEIGNLNLSTLVVQEGGYNTRTIGVNAKSFFEGLWQGMLRP